MLRAVADHEPIFRNIADPEAEEKLPERVEETITNRRFFDNIQTVLSVCAPSAESIGRLEQRKSTLADCLIEFLRIVYRLQKKQKTLDQDLLSHVKKVVNLRYNQYVTGYHVLALYLHPSGKDLFHSS
eukprot:gb/GECG01014968.1/.p1 GENE.gb/GECG01014968.1/~~gb/GECG01014968.1/.p1  ORF type:complete len:128 (+),score=9.72 gb/GECG01014968.1/:1-384(+)